MVMCLVVLTLVAVRKVPHLHDSGNVNTSGSGTASADSGTEVLDKDCCPCTASQVAEATSSYFKDILLELVETPLFRAYTPYPNQADHELHDVQCSIPEFQELALELSSSQLGCAIEQCSCSEMDCPAENWRQQPCGSDTNTETLEQGITRVSPTIPLPASNSSAGPVQYDLTENPEQFTGYGMLLDDKSARLIWENLYTDRFCLFSCPENNDEPSAEKRLVYQVVSGLQASINTHLSMHYGIYTDTQEPATRENWRAGRDLSFGPWKALFDDRVGRHPDRVRNMHFVFALMLRALHTISPRLDHLLEASRNSCPKCAEQYNQTKDLLQSLVAPSAQARECSAVLHAFDPSVLFADQDPGTVQLKEELKRRLQRMGEMMTCVGCDRCKLWGTLQFHAARVAVGVLINDEPIDDDNNTSQFGVPSLSSLRPNDIVALVNTMAQLSKSIHQAKQWARAPHAEF